jgi:hypothetical protein
MKKIFYSVITLCIATSLVLVSCDKANNDGDINDLLNSNSNTASLSDDLLRANDIPAEYDSIGMIYNNHFAAISLALIRKGFRYPANDEIVYAAKEYFKTIDPDFDTTVIVNVDITAIGDGMDSLNSDQQKIVSKINNLLENASSAGAFVQQIPTMVSLIYTLPSEDRGQAFIYLAIAKYAALDRAIITSATVELSFFGKCCAVWGAINFLTGGVANGHPAGAALSIACIIYAFF